MSLSQDLNKAWKLQKHTGKNLFDISGVEALKASNGVDYSSFYSSEGGLITIRYGYYGNALFLFPTISLVAGTYMLSADVKTPESRVRLGHINVADQTVKGAYSVVPENTWTRIFYKISLDTEQPIALQLQAIGNASDFTHLNLQLRNIQLEEGSVATDYESYCGTHEHLTATNCKGGYFSTVDDYGLKVMGKTEQKQLSGKNLLPYPFASTSHTIAGITFTDNGDGSITMNGTSTGYAPYTLAVSCPFEANKSYTISGSSLILCYRYADGVTKYLGSGGTVTWQADYQFVQLYLQVSPGTTVTNETAYPQVELGTVVTPYEPYCGGIPVPNPYNPVPIQCVKQGTKIKTIGKNLFNHSSVVNDRYIRSADGGVGSMSGVSASEYICVAGIKRIISSGDAFMRTNGGAFYDVMHKYISGFTTAEIVGGTNVPNNAYYVRVTATSDVLQAIQIEEDSVTVYEPYRENEITVPCDLYDGDVWYPMTGKVVKSKGIKILNGTESWVLEPLGTKHDIFTVISNKAHGYKNLTVSHYPIASNITIYGFIGRQNNSAVSVNDPEIATDVASWKAWLAENNITIVYELLESITEQYAPQPCFTYNGTVHVLSVAEDLAPKLSATVFTHV